MALWPAATSCSAAARTADSLMSANATEAPASAKAFAVASPIPEPAPVTSATLFSRDRFINAFLYLWTDSTFRRSAHLFLEQPLALLSPIRHSLQFFRVPGALHSDLCGGDVELPEIIRGELDGNRSDVLFKALQFRGAGHRNDPGF